MSIGLGKQYWVHCIKVYFGSLDQCIKFMQDNKPDDDLHWFELRPLVVVKKGQKVSCSEYSVSLVEDAK